MSQEKELLDKLLNFYKKRNPNKFESDFNKSAIDLIKTNDIQKKTYLIFCLDNNIEPIINQSTYTSKIKRFEEESDDSFGISGCDSGFRKSYC